jgi:hypothetical protein
VSVDDNRFVAEIALLEVPSARVWGRPSRS